jgi:chromosome segregation protein
MHINRLRLHGFKSFVEPTELVIDRGLTGVVGPNGCGKSNLLEALRWVMGETSYKSMRAATMEDVIFNGTTQRPARNVAEVTIMIDNAARTAPADFNDNDVLEVTRRIERDMGSAYRINSREARARDVKILFEDAATGARSPALVRQGQIAELVNAKPEQRRRILEDAAGIAGLHSRRHEAELRLKAAEQNLARLQDVLGGLQSQIEGLKRQARHARRYKELSGEIRRAEAMALHLAWTSAQREVDTAESALTEALSRLAQATETQSRLTREEAELAEALPPLRDEEAKRGAILARIRIEIEAFEKEAERLAARQRDYTARADQSRRDIEREEAMLAEAREILERLVAEAQALAALEAEQAGVEEQARAAMQAAQEAVQAADAYLAEVTRRAFEARARRTNLEQALADRRNESEKLARQLAALEQQKREVVARAPDARKLTETTARGQQLALEVAAIELQALAADEKVTELAAEAASRREASHAARLQANRLSTEMETLTKLLVPLRDDDLPPIVDLLRVNKGYEVALGAALGDDLDAPADDSAAAHWRRIDMGLDDPVLMDGVEPLADHVDAPPELARRLRQIGVVDREDGHALQPLLRPGQRLVSREGDLWRWDGFVTAADAPTPAAQRLAERNRLGDIERRATSAKREAADLASAERTTTEMHRMAEAEERRLRQLWRETQAELARARDQLNAIERQARETEARLSTLEDARSSAEDASLEAHSKIAELQEALEQMGVATELEEELEAADVVAREKRTTFESARLTLSDVERERQVRTERYRMLETEHDRWSGRGTAADAQVATLRERLAEAEAELAELADLPKALEERRHHLLDQQAEADRERQAAADRLAAAETALRQGAAALRAAQAAVTTERETRARTEAKLEGARQRRLEEVGRINETLGCAPEAVLALAEHPTGKELPEQVATERDLQRLKGERERLGGVNLQAEDELAKINDQHASLDLERLDVEGAIAKLRGGIGQLNREAKNRLQTAFEAVDRHFQSLFGTLFGGGEAKLEMIESEEDPLEGGLEIIAKPPGKKPATLSLLSGGEQTLTALSLIFAVFLTNPSPICVLDEVDAPLDDANVDRFCTMMEKMAADTDTRFLVITHHPMTMARMNRLFGVTMAEKGVSQLVSVDLATAERIIENEPQQGAA